MNTLVVYFSKFGNTQRVAEAIAEELQSAGSARTLGTEQLTAAQVQGVDLAVMGTPTHKMNLPEAVRPVLQELPRGILRGVPIAAFDTSYKMSTFLARFTAAKKLNRKLRRLGGRPIVPPETFHVTGSEGPLYDGEIDRARRWAGLILERLEIQGA
jgi:flavodoxin